MKLLHIHVKALICRLCQSLSYAVNNLKESYTPRVMFITLQLSEPDTEKKANQHINCTRSFILEARAAQKKEEKKVKPPWSSCDQKAIVKVW